MPAGAVTIRSQSSDAIPQRSNRRPSATPLGPVDTPTVRAARTARRTASSSPMSGRRAPARTATATGDCARSTALPAVRWPVAISFSMASRESATTSNASPACTRRVTSTPPTDSSATACPVPASKARDSSVSTAFVAIDEIADTGLPRLSSPSGARKGVRSLVSGTLICYMKAVVRASLPRSFEEFAVGLRFRSAGAVTVTAEGIKAFAGEFDPQPPHLDEEAARRTSFGGLVASGWHTAALAMRLIVDSDLGLAGQSAGVAVESMQWRLPVRAGDALHVEG